MNEMKNTKQCAYCKEPFTPIRSTKIYCSDRCRGFAHLEKENAPQKSRNQKDGEDDNVKATLKTVEGDMAEGISSATKLNIKSVPALVKRKGVQEEKGEFFELIAEIETRPDFVKSKLVELMNEKVRYKWLFEDSCWHDAELIWVKWVTERFLCLLENLLHLCSCREVEAKIVRSLHAGFKEITKSYQFDFLPLNYPYASKIRELTEKTGSLLEESGRTVFLQLSLKGKAEIIAIIHEVRGFVELQPFEELFTKE